METPIRNSLGTKRVVEAVEPHDAVIILKKLRHMGCVSRLYASGSLGGTLLSSLVQA